MQVETKTKSFFVANIYEIGFKKKTQHLRNNLVILFIDSFVFLLPVILNHLTFQSFDFNVISETRHVR